jgi:DNA polymerase III delta prime subunit
MELSEHLDKHNPHHAYLIEGAREEIVPEILKFAESLGVGTLGNPDFSHIAVDTFKIDDAFDLRSMAAHKGFSRSKRIFLLSVNSFTLDAQNVLLKMFEEPTPGTHFFLIVPDANALLQTLVSRFYFISARQPARSITERDSGGDRAILQESERFIAMPLVDRINFIKELLVESDEEDAEGNEIVALDSARSKALAFLNALELTLHEKIMSRSALGTDAGFFSHFFKVRTYLRMPGSSVKSLMESVALITPNF